jgi:hypothetical protein
MAINLGEAPVVNEALTTKNRFTEKLTEMRGKWFGAESPAVKGFGSSVMEKEIVDILDLVNGIFSDPNKVTYTMTSESEELVVPGLGVKAVFDEGRGEFTLIKGINDRREGSLIDTLQGSVKFGTNISYSLELGGNSGRLEGNLNKDNASAEGQGAGGAIIGFINTISK